MGEGLFGSLKNVDRQQNKIIQESSPTISTQMSFNGLDGTPMPLPTSNGSDLANPQPSYGLPQTKSKAPWDVGDETKNEIAPNPNRNANAFPQQNTSQNVGWQAPPITPIPQNNNTKPQEEIPASMYGYSETNNMGRHPMLNGYGQINANPYSQQRIQSQQAYNNAYYNQPQPIQQPTTTLNNSRLDALFKQEVGHQQESLQSGLNPFGEDITGFGTTGIEIENAHDHPVIDRTANIKYIQAGHNNITSGSSQYGLCDVSTKEWTKQNMILAIPFVNLFYVLYVGYMQTFIKYPTLKEWARGAIINTILVNIAWIMAFYSLFLLTSQ